ncbi:HalOD1 output domain-containing protein [Salinibaculum salinum]|uniref:HalOD1 output domain-containing protein n=1 Tax=Salinibaculum salinum TaxID=3131996 RepID=UPI0030EDE99F
MSTKSNRRASSSWEELARHDWSDNQAIETTLTGALQELDCSTDGKLLYDYIDLEAVTNTFGPEESRCGASEVRFDFEDYEIRIAQDGTIGARKR